MNNDYKLPFRFTGTIDKLTFKLGPEQLTDADRKAIAERLAAGQGLGGQAIAVMKTRGRTIRRFLVSEHSAALRDRGD